MTRPRCGHDTARVPGKSQRRAGRREWRNRERYAQLPALPKRQERPVRKVFTNDPEKNES